MFFTVLADQIIIALYIPHGITILEDAEVVDVFSPAREDFL